MSTQTTTPLHKASWLSASFCQANTTQQPSPQSMVITQNVTHMYLWIFSAGHTLLVSWVNIYTFHWKFGASSTSKQQVFILSSGWLG